MVDVRQTGLSAQRFAEQLLEGYGVSVLAGEAFGPSAAGHIRIGLVVDQTRLADACRRIALCAADLLISQAAMGTPSHSQGFNPGAVSRG
ncbi:Arginine--pyruvate transaminase AruH [compost metagenome]